MLIDPVTGERLPATLTVTRAAKILGLPERTVRQQAAAGLLPTMRRPGPRGQHRIITAKLLQMLGVFDVAEEA